MGNGRGKVTCGWVDGRVAQVVVRRRPTLPRLLRRGDHRLLTSLPTTKLLIYMFHVIFGALLIILFSFQIYNHGF